MEILCRRAGLGARARSQLALRASRKTVMVQEGVPLVPTAPTGCSADRDRPGPFFSAPNRPRPGRSRLIPQTRLEALVLGKTAGRAFIWLVGASAIELVVVIIA